jgi:hypothetical protein
MEISFLGSKKILHIVECLLNSQKVLSRPSADSFAVGRRQKWGYQQKQKKNNDNSNLIRMYFYKGAFRQGSQLLIEGHPAGIYLPTYILPWLNLFFPFVHLE